MVNGVQGSMVKSSSSKSMIKQTSSKQFLLSQTNSEHKLSVHKLNKNSTNKPFISFGHDNWNLVLHMIFGVSKSVRNAIFEEVFSVCEEDFARKY